MLKANLKTIIGLAYILMLIVFFGYLLIAHPNCQNMKRIADHCIHKKSLQEDKATILATTF